MYDLLNFIYISFADLSLLAADIPDTIWAAIIAAVISFLSVTQSNYFHSKNLKSQLDHNRNELEQKRVLELQKDAYMESIACFPKINKMLLNLPSDEEKSDESLNHFSSSFFKINLVAPQNIVETLNIINSQYTKAYLHLFKKASEIKNSKQEIEQLEEILKSKLDQQENLLSTTKSLVDSEKMTQDLANSISKSFDIVSSEILETSQNINTKAVTYKELNKNYLETAMEFFEELEPNIEEYTNLIRENFGVHRLENKEYFSSLKKDLADHLRSFINSAK